MKNQLKYFILICGLICGINLSAQGYGGGVDCATATPIGFGKNVVNSISTGGGFQNICGWPSSSAANARWFIYTATASKQVIVKTCLEGQDTRVSIFSGSCAGLTCVASSDDDCAMTSGGSEYASEVLFFAAAGTTYYIQFDDRWDTDPFSFYLEEWCPSVGQNVGDWCFSLPGHIVSDFCFCVPFATPDCINNAYPADGATDVPIEGPSNSVYFSWNWGYQPVDEYDLYWGPYGGTLSYFATLSSQLNQGIGVSGVVAGHYQWQIRPSNAAGETTGCPIYTLSTVGAPPFCFNINGAPGDLCAGGVISDDCTCVPITVPDCPTLLIPADGATEVPIDVPNSNSVDLDWSLNGFQPIDDVNIYFAEAPGPPVFLGTLPAGVDDVTLNNIVPGTYVWQVVPVNSVGEATGCAIYQFTTEGVATFDCPALELDFGDFCQTADIADGYIDQNCDCISVAPICPTLLSPADEATITLQDDILSWNIAPTGTPAASVWVFYGLEGQTSNFYTQLDASVQSVQLTPGILVEGESYYWFIVPISEDGNANDCATSAFTFTVESAIDNCPTDFNSDGTTNGEDFSLFLGSFDIPCPASCPTDLNGDGLVDGTDFSLFLGNFGLDCPPTE